MPEAERLARSEAYQAAWWNVWSRARVEPVAAAADWFERAQVAAADAARDLVWNGEPVA